VTVNAQQVLSGSGAGPDDTAIAQEVLAEAQAYVTAYIASSLVDAAVPVPDEITDAAVLTCAVDLFARRKAPFGQQVTVDSSGVSMTTRLGADPLGGVRPKLRPWCLSIGFAYPEDEA
jgi:hypothetical protein